VLQGSINKRRKTRNKKKGETRERKGTKKSKAREEKMWARWAKRFGFESCIDGIVVISPDLSCSALR
jgi:hypothetical protein